ncbi:MAG TPA: hypothetical protein VF464_03570, partial [Candidatus Methylomirabilis sp.]
AGRWRATPASSPTRIRRVSDDDEGPPRRRHRVGPRGRALYSNELEERTEPIVKQALFFRRW